MVTEKEDFLMPVNKPQRCADCSAEVGSDSGPPDGWQLEDGRTVCNSCCIIDTKRFAKILSGISHNGTNASHPIDNA